MNKSPFEIFIESPRKLVILDLLIVLPFLILPLLLQFPYRVNIFLTWEGAYRLYLGQVPFQDFGLPMGFGFWLIPALFFKLFGPSFMSLIKAQVLINLLSVVAIRGILYKLKIKPIAITLTILVFCLTYTIYNFWPWYNHSVVVFELIAIYFLLSYLVDEGRIPSRLVSLTLAGFFTFVAFFTKQDVGGICFFICVFLLCYYSIKEKKIQPLLIYIVAFSISAALFIVPFLKYDFLYWFNYGQEPHSSRISIKSLLDILLAQSTLEKVYLLIILFAITIRIKSWKSFIDNNLVFFTITIVLAFTLQSIVTRVTSPLPTDHMSYFHTFGFVGISLFFPWEKWSTKLIYVLCLSTLLVGLYSSGVWQYVSRLMPIKHDLENLTQTPYHPWTSNSWPTMKNVLLPAATNSGIDRLMELPILKNKDLKVLNMTELTSLAREIGYTPLTQQPLWYHLNIGIFEREVEEINQKVAEGYYDMVLFQSIPSLNNFYPYKVLDKLKEKYFLYDTFLAPRKLEDSNIQVFIRPNLAKQFELKQVNDSTIRPTHE
ncbi:MAG: hypothetical protein KDC93_11735 [Cyclobacteriaceae bacterium]|nr:hypothetical protein [Cyclobacteriaceae bacterium]